ncbi:MAG: coproporphyrinogen III oxidase, partial [Erysipelotrichaceae bacterium]|nr:coproporphyrinogen III oxidase [Erysipelotrichaceae bacterium]
GAGTEEREVLSRKEQMEEFMFLGLRLTDGVSRKEFFDLFKQDLDHTFEGVIPKLRSEGLLLSEGDQIRLTDRGMDVSNTVLAEFLLTS